MLLFFTWKVANLDHLKFITRKPVWKVKFCKTPCQIFSSDKYVLCASYESLIDWKVLRYGTLLVRHLYSKGKSSGCSSNPDIHFLCNHTAGLSSRPSFLASHKIDIHSFIYMRPDITLYRCFSGIPRICISLGMIPVSEWLMSD